MKKQNTDSVQNRFTAYLIAAVVHQRMRYMEKKKSLLQRDDEEQTWRSEKNCRRCRWTVRGEGDRDDNAGL